MRISPESVQQSDEIIGMPCSVAAAHTGRTVALIGPRPGIDHDLWLLVWRPGDDSPSYAMSAPWSPGSMMSLQAVARVDDPETIIRVAGRVPA
jgi:hypothetical protein